jgi:hypothetical protein
VLAHRDGRVFVADGGSLAIYVFDAEGALVRTIGRRGSGPGEFSALYSIAWLGDTLAALDPGNARIGLYANGETWVGAWRYQPLTGDPREIRMLRSDSGEFYVPVVTGPSGRRWVRFTHAGRADTVPEPPPDPRDRRDAVTCFASDGTIAGFAAPFAARTTFAFGPAGTVAVSWTGEYRIVLQAPGWRRGRVITRPYRPTGVSDEAWDSALGPYRRFRERHPSARCDREAPLRPEDRPAIGRLFWDGDGHLAVEALSGGETALDLYDTTGVLLKTLLLPPHDERVEPQVVGDRLYLVGIDSLGIQVLRAFMLSGP